MTTAFWYSQLIKPSWVPPSWLFGPVWTVLYTIIALTYGTIFYKIIKGQLPRTLATPLILNLAFNLAFTPLQFGLRNNYLAAIDIILVLVTLIYSLRAVYSHLKWAALLNIPYLLWVTFATFLQLTITWLNR
ncbi:MAG: TspO/MBR family protein [Patescibacteria group bacterium]